VSQEKSLNRRAFLTGGPPDRHYISSAVVIALPAKLAAVRTSLESMTGVEIHAAEGSRVVVTIEGPTSGSLGETLVQMSLLDGVLAANMVYEHVEEGAPA
jgi:nitrate reductase NapD